MLIRKQYSDFTLLIKVNIFHKSKTDTEKSVAALDVALGKLKNDLKTLEQLFYYFAFQPFNLLEDE